MEAALGRGAARSASRLTSVCMQLLQLSILTPFSAAAIFSLAIQRDDLGICQCVAVLDHHVVSEGHTYIHTGSRLSSLIHSITQHYHARMRRMQTLVRN